MEKFDTGPGREELNRTELSLAGRGFSFALRPTCCVPSCTSLSRGRLGAQSVLPHCRDGTWMPPFLGLFWPHVPWPGLGAMPGTRRARWGEREEAPGMQSPGLCAGAWGRLGEAGGARGRLGSPGEPGRGRQTGAPSCHQHTNWLCDVGQVPLRL